MAYEANRDDRDFETARADANNTNTIILFFMLSQL